MAQELTAKERKTLEAAERILANLITHKGESLMLSYHGGWESISVTYFTPNRMQHSGVIAEERNFAAKMQEVLNIRAAEEARADEFKAQRIAELKKQLADLGEAV